MHRQFSTLAVVVFVLTAMVSDPQVGEVVGGLQAPHVVFEGGKYHMFYGDWNSICHAISDDGKTLERVIQPSGKTAMFSEGAGNNTRDVMMLKVADTWHAYDTAGLDGRIRSLVRSLH